MSLPARDPADGPGELLLEPHVAPRLGEMAERVVVDATLAVGLRPGQREIAGASDRSRIEPEQDMHARARIVAKRVELFQKRKSIAKTRRRRMGLVLDQDRALLRPRVLFEVGADDRTVVRPFVQRVRG